MKKTKKFIPLVHEYLDLKNGLIYYARELSKKEDLEAKISSAFIYVSFIEYLSGNLLENLRHFVYKASYKDYAGIIFIDETDDNKPKTLGEIIYQLGKFGFPDKDKIISLLKDLNKLRTNLFHNFAKADSDSLDKMIKQDVVTIQEKSEDIFDRINTLYAGLSKILIPAEDTNSSDGVDPNKDIDK